MFTKTTRNFKITVFPNYLAAQSDPANDHFVWAYTIQMENLGHETFTLQNRHWHITDGRGMVQEVRGPGVVGEHPRFEAGDGYRYTSGVALKTSSGLMRGNYEMQTQFGERFMVEIPAFSLDSPEGMRRAN